jgi:hypothetical protein
LLPNFTGGRVPKSEWRTGLLIAGYLLTKGVSDRCDAPECAG